MRGVHVAVLLTLGAAALGTMLFVKRTDQQTNTDRASRTTGANDIAERRSQSASPLDALTTAQGSSSSIGKTPTLLSEPDVTPPRSPARRHRRRPTRLRRCATASRLPTQ